MIENLILMDPLLVRLLAPAVALIAALTAVFFAVMAVRAGHWAEVHTSMAQHEFSMGDTTEIPASYREARRLYRRQSLCTTATLACVAIAIIACTMFWQADHFLLLEGFQQ